MPTTGLILGNKSFFETRLNKAVSRLCREEDKGKRASFSRLVGEAVFLNHFALIILQISFDRGFSFPKHPAFACLCLCWRKTENLENRGSEPQFGFRGQRRVVGF